MPISAGHTRCSSDAALITVEPAFILAASSFVIRQRNRAQATPARALPSWYRAVTRELRFRFMPVEETWNNLSSRLISTHSVRRAFISDSQRCSLRGEHEIQRDFRPSDLSEEFRTIARSDLIRQHGSVRKLLSRFFTSHCLAIVSIFYDSLRCLVAV